MAEYHRPAPLDAAHDRSGFDSGSATLDEWLVRFAGQSRRGNTAATWVITDANGVVVAYASLSMTGIDRSAAPSALARHAPNPVPALLIGRLAVDRRHAGIGLGTALVVHALMTAIELNETAACKAIVVVALDEAARRWWNRLGFVSFDAGDPTCMDLYVLTKDAKATLEHLG